ncbi:MAG: hypothetical protein M0016_01850 [Deltaproteobacteria bacterium]|jgi:predicted RNA binding protein YcfA (HicA-like mRNA interferase family)|nr:hypothetical protein [Deltaproteobacteria bacterium]MCL5879826.1 hypothetical protein [Deltaproteobacteria bacterium]MDA8303891.1 hypothetical protein [Deltaproteobacteria bacterium]
MKNFKNKKPLAIFLLFLAAIYLFSFILVPLIHRYYSLNTIYAGKVNAVKLLKIKLINTKKVKIIKFRAGCHRLSTNLLTILSYINYLNKLGWNINVKISHKRFKHINSGKNVIQNAPRFKLAFGHSNFTGGNKYEQKNRDKITKSVMSKGITVSLNKVSNVGVIFSLIKTFREFPVEIKKISINTNNTNKNISVVMNLKLISLKGFYKK